MKKVEEIRARFEVLTNSASWINSDTYPNGRIYTHSYVDWLEKEVIRASDQNAQLRKEVEELKASLVDERANGRIEWERLQLSEITRLRELLERAKKELMMCATSKTQQLLADIEKETRDR